MSTEQWSPRDEKNPFRVWTMMISEEWLEVTRWYPFSVRVLVVLRGNDAEWHEEARCKTWEKAKQIMQVLARSREGHVQTFVVMKCERRGKEGRERPVLWYPSEGIVRSRMRELSKR
jgi:hypothetical protein